MAKPEPSSPNLVDETVRECMEFIDKRVGPSTGFDPFTEVSFYTKLIERLEAERDDVEGANEHD